MSEVLKGRGNGLTSASLLRAWKADYSRGKYTEVARAWLDGRACLLPQELVADSAALEAVGWSLALTKSWNGYDVFRADIAACTPPEAPPLLAVLDAWRTIHDARYDAGLHAARGVRQRILEPGSDVRTLSQALRVEGVALLRLGRYEEAETATRQALDLALLGGDLLGISHCATNLGLILNARGEIPAARVALRRSVEALLEAGAAEERIALARVNLAVVELHLGDIDAASRLFEASLVVFEQFDLRSEQITALNGLGHCERVRGDLRAAESRYMEALQRADLQMARQVALCHEFLGQICFDNGRHAEAEQHYERAWDIAANIAPDGDLMLEVCWRFAELLVAAGRAAEATPYLQRAEELVLASQEMRERGCVQRARARWLASQDDPGARDAFESACALLASRPFEAALTLLAGGEWARSRGDDTTAHGMFERARSILTGIAPASPWLARIESDQNGALPSTGADLEPAPDARWGIVTRDAAFSALLDELPQLAATPYPVLVEGETGTGKELLSRAVHAAVPRTGSFVAVNCAAIPRDLFESELFGHARGAFSGAQIEKVGLLEQADGGTLLLDEIGEMPPELQTKLLRFLDDGVVRRIGEVRQRAVRVKIVAATNRPLESSVDGGGFRSDLFHRLAVHHVRLVPLRRRRTDIEVLARHFVAQEGFPAPIDWTPALLADLESRPWPGNARELRNHLIRLATQRRSHGGEAESLRTSLRSTRRAHERRVIEATLASTGGHVGDAARALHLHVTTLRRKMRALGIRRPTPSALD